MAPFMNSDKTIEAFHNQESQKNTKRTKTNKNQKVILFLPGNEAYEIRIYSQKMEYSQLRLISTPLI